MTFSHFNRRSHLYLGLALLPWVLLYGVSSVPFSHAKYFDDLDKAKGLPDWTLIADRPYDVPVPSQPDYRAFGAQVCRDAKLDGAFGVYRPNPSETHVYVYSFWQSFQVKYFHETKRLTVQKKRFRLDHILTGMHAKGGFAQDGWLHDAWAVLVDLVSLSFLAWIASGIYMWWKLPGLRAWGWVALGCGFGAFILLLFRL
jgi:hypothetical protein